jgi:hypothetical protein
MDDVVRDAWCVRTLERANVHTWGGRWTEALCSGRSATSRDVTYVFTLRWRPVQVRRKK